jgi:hypothetical protein
MKIGSREWLSRERADLMEYIDSQLEIIKYLETMEDKPGMQDWIAYEKSILKYYRGKLTLLREDPYGYTQKELSRLSNRAKNTRRA